MPSAHIDPNSTTPRRLSSSSRNPPTLAPPLPFNPTSFATSSSSIALPAVLNWSTSPGPSPFIPPVVGPPLANADDSIVLSDLLRSGEASRLRRRGALRNSVDQGRGPHHVHTRSNSDGGGSIRRRGSFSGASGQVRGADRDGEDANSTGAEGDPDRTPVMNQRRRSRSRSPALGSARASHSWMNTATSTQSQERRTHQSLNITPSNQRSNSSSRWNARESRRPRIGQASIASPSANARLHRSTKEIVNTLVTSLTDPWNTLLESSIIRCGASLHSTNGEKGKEPIRSFGTESAFHPSPLPWSSSLDKVDSLPRRYPTDQHEESSGCGEALHFSAIPYPCLRSPDDHALDSMEMFWVAVSTLSPSTSHLKLPPLLHTKDTGLIGHLDEQYFPRPPQSRSAGRNSLSRRGSFVLTSNHSTWHNTRGRPDLYSSEVESDEEEDPHDVVPLNTSNIPNLIYRPESEDSSESESDSESSDGEPLFLPSPRRRTSNARPPSDYEDRDNGADDALAVTTYAAEEGEDTATTSGRHEHPIRDDEGHSMPGLESVSDSEETSPSASPSMSNISLPEEPSFRPPQEHESHLLEEWDTFQSRVQTIKSEEGQELLKVRGQVIRSECGCVWEGMGCKACGNPLGTRYIPCAIAVQDFLDSLPQLSGASSGSTSTPVPSTQMYVQPPRRSSLTQFTRNYVRYVDLRTWPGFTPLTDDPEHARIPNDAASATRTDPKPTTPKLCLLIFAPWSVTASTHATPAHSESHTLQADGDVISENWHDDSWVTSGASGDEDYTDEEDDVTRYREEIYMARR